MSNVLDRLCIHALTVGMLMAGCVAPALAATGGSVAASCAKLANSAEREPSWYDSACRAPGAKAAALEAAEASFAAPANVTNATAPAALGDPGYQLDVRAVTNTFETFALPNAAAPGATVTVPYDSFALEHDNATGTLWAVENTAIALGTINKATGAFTAVVPITGLPAATIPGGLAFVNGTSTFYLSTTTELYSLNRTTGVATLIGPFGITGGLMIDVAINSAGQMFGHEIFTDSIYSINTATGAATLVGPTGVLANFAQSIDFDKNTGVLYAWIYEGTGVNRFSSINLTTGAATTLATPTNKEYEGALTPVSLQSFSVD